MWHDAMEHRREVMGPLQRKYEAFLEHTVEYGRAALRTALELNGGGIIALPSLGSLFGSFWAHGRALPAIGVLAFLLGLVAAATGYAFSFFHFMDLQGWTMQEMSRKANFLNAQFNATAAGQPIPKEDETPTEDETRFRNRASANQRAAIGVAVLSLFAFIVGAIITAYILAWPISASGGR